MEYVNKAVVGLEAAPGVVNQITCVVDEASHLVEAAQNFGEKISGLIDQTIEKVELLEHEAIKNNRDAIASKENILYVSDYALDFIDKLDDLFWFGQNEEQIKRIKDALNRGNYQPLHEHTKRLVTCLSQAEQHYKKFQDKCQEAKTNCHEVAGYCEHMSVTARNKKIATQAVGGTTAAVAMAAGIGTGITLSIIAGAFTFGIGTIVGLGITGASTAVAGSAVGLGTAAATHYIACNFNETKTTFENLAATFDSMRQIASEMQRSIGIIKLKLQLLEQSIDNIKSFDDSKESICLALDQQYKRYYECYVLTNSCHQQLKSKREALHLHVHCPSK